MTTVALFAAYNAGVLRARHAYRQHLAELADLDAQCTDDNPGGGVPSRTMTPRRPQQSRIFFGGGNAGERVNATPRGSNR